MSRSLSSFMVYYSMDELSGQQWLWQQYDCKSLQPCKQLFKWFSSCMHSKRNERSVSKYKMECLWIELIL